MSDALVQAGAQPKSPSKWAPIYSSEFFSGFFSNRNPLRDPATPFIYGKFYSATRYEAIWDGLNMEISPRLTLVRGPGHSVYNSQSFSGIVDYYSYHTTGVNIPNSIKVVVDAKADDDNPNGAVWDATGPDTKKLIYSKAAGSQQTRFIAIGNTLYMGDGVNNYEYLTASYAWKASSDFPSGAFVVDQNGFVQLALGYATPLSSVSIAGGVLTAAVTSLANIAVGTTVQLFGTVTAFLNEVTLVVTSVDNIGLTFTADINSVNLPSEVEPNAFVVVPSVDGTTAPAGVFWNDAFNGLTYDHSGTGNLLWKQSGPALRPWGVPRPTTVATVANTINDSVASPWVAATYYMPFPLIFASSSIYKLTTAGLTGVAPPAFGPSIVTDGTAVWTDRGSADRVPSATYAAGDLILVTWTVTTVVPGPIIGYKAFNDQPIYGPPTTKTITYSCFFQCVQPGDASSASTSDILWQSGLGVAVQDGDVIWNNVGYEITRTSAATSSPVITSTALVPGNISNSQNLSGVNQIVDENGAVESVIVAGQTGPTVPPVWSKTAGGTTPEGTGLVWTNLGNSPAVGGTASGFGTWVYTYAYVDEVTGSVGPAAPISAAIVLAADSYIKLQGAYTAIGPLPASLGLINIYRSTTNEAVPFLIAQIANVPGGGIWTYNDFSPDQGFPGSTMNNAIEADLVGYNSPPPTGFLPVELHLSSIWGFVNSVLYYSAGGDVVDDQGGWEAFPTGNFISFQTQGFVGWSTGSGMYVMLQDSIQLVAGISAPFNVSRVVKIGIQSSNCFSLNGQSPYIFTADRQLIGIDPSAGVTVDGYPIANILAKSPFDPSRSYVTWHVDGTDQRLFVSDGASGYYGMLNSIAPEPPASVWSPKREVVGGCSAVKSIETSPGRYQLLVGPSTSGPILFRDLNAATDNDRVYEAWAVIGSNVLCHPGQIAEIGFLHLEANRVGITPALAVLMDEVYGMSGCPPFDPLPRLEHDPPRLPRIRSLYSNRYYLTQAETPAFCRHIQVRISFNAEDALNEVLSFTIFGSIRLERAGTGVG